MKQIENEINNLYVSCGIMPEDEYPIQNGFNAGELYKRLHSDDTAFARNSSFSYAACGASSVGLDWLTEQGFRF